MKPRRVIGIGGFRASPLAKKYVNQVLDSGRLSYGRFHRKFESAFAKAHGVKYAAFCNSGTSALHVAVQALKEKHGWKDGSEVLVPAVTFVATANVVLHNRLTPVFVDVDPITFMMEPYLVATRITHRTRAIIPVHLLGLPADMAGIQLAIKRKNLSVIEDSAETVLAKILHKSVGSMGHIGCFSTYAAHHLVTGVGGLTTTDDPDLHTRLRSLMNHGRDSIYLSIDDDAKAKGKRLEEIVSKRFQFISAGHSFRATELEAAIGLAGMETLEASIKRRQEIARVLTNRLSVFEDRLQLPHIPLNRTHSFMMYGLVLRGKDKTPLVNFLESRGIETRDLLPLINQPVYRNLYGNLDSRCPVAAMLNRSAFYIGCHPEMTNADIDYIIEQFSEYFRRK